MEHRNDRHPPIWAQLNTKTVGDNAASDIQLVSDPVHLQYSNRQSLGDIALVNAAGMRSDGGIIPDTVAFKVHSFSDNGTETIIEPKQGEIWQVLFPVARTTAGSISTTVDYELWLYDVATGTDFRIFYFGSTSSKPILNEDTSWDGEAFSLGYGTTLRAEIGTFSGTAISFGVLAGRVR